jgi:hypothetical protein
MILDQAAFVYLRDEVVDGGTRKSGLANCGTGTVALLGESAPK